MTANEIENILVEDFDKNKYKLKELLNNQTYIILFNRYNCFDCFDKLKRDSLDNKDYFIIVRCENNIIERKEILTLLKSVFANTNIYFDIHEEVDSWPPRSVKQGIFGLFNIVFTPAILVFNGALCNYYSFFDLFKKNEPLTDTSKD